MLKENRRQIISWALYDWADSAFATSVMAGFFPVFFKTYWSAHTDVSISTFHLGAANSVASLILALAAPILGAIADCTQSKKKFLISFAFLGSAMTAALYFVSQGRWIAAAILYVLATIGFSGGNIFYDSLLISIAPRNKTDMASAWGYAFGYMGGGLLFALSVALVITPHSFGIANTEIAIRLSFLLTAVWWGGFSLPLMLFVPEPAQFRKKTTGWAISDSLAELTDTFCHLRTLRPVFLFLIAYFLYIDGVHTVIRMAVDYGMSLGFSANSLLTALLITQFVGFPAAICFGKLGEHYGARQGILIGIAIYLGVITWGYFMDQEAEFFALAVAVGLVQGGVQSLSRSLYAQLIPPEKAAQFFGFYNMWGKFAAVIGPVLMGWASLLTGNPRASILAISILFIAGALLLWKLDIRKPAAAGMEERC